MEKHKQNYEYKEQIGGCRREGFGGRKAIGEGRLFSICKIY